MPYTFDEAVAAFKSDQIRELGLDADGLRFLKLRSLSRKEHLNRLIRDHGLATPEGRPQSRLRAVFESPVTEGQIDATIRGIYATERADRAANEDALISELYKLQMFDWGSLHQNSLEGTIVNNYVKKIRYFMPFKRVSLVLQSRFGFPGSADGRFGGGVVSETTHR